MFREFLNARPMGGLLSDKPFKLFPSIDDRAAWAGLTAKRLEEVRRGVEAYRDMEYPLLKATQFMAFSRSGSRTAWEDPYFRRRRKLIAALLDACLDGDLSRIDEVVDGIWLVCEETSWVVSAHNIGGPAFEWQVLPDVENPVIDLFAGQTAMILSLTCALLGEHLDDISPLIRRRVRLEIEKRILKPFEHRDDFWWMGNVGKTVNNWTPWVVSNVMLTAATWVEDRRRLAHILTRGCGMLDCYLDVMPQDGGCDEGAAYWGMAGGALLDCLELLETLTEGRMTFWEDEKICAILQFPLNAWVGGRWFVNFADCDAGPDMYGERLQFAGLRTGCEGLAALGARFPGDIGQMLNDTPQLWRLLNMLFHPIREAKPWEPPKDLWLDSLQLRIARRNGATLICKGGWNDDSHNHNDVGAFMLYVDDEPQIVDAGNLVYSKKTFSSERYTLWNIRSMYHNVPLIGGFEQAPGPQYRARGARCEADGLVADIAPAYPAEAGVEKCLRRFSFSDDGALTLRDEIETAGACSTEWVFMLRCRPERIDGGVRSGAIAITADAPMPVEIEEIPIEDRRMSRHFPGSLWRVRFIGTAAKRTEAAFDIRRVEA